MRQSKLLKQHFSSVTRIRIPSTARSARGRAKRPPNGEPRISVANPNGANASAHSPPLVWASLRQPIEPNENTYHQHSPHLGKLNLAFMDLAKAFFLERGHQLAKTFVERGEKAGG